MIMVHFNLLRKINRLHFLPLLVMAILFFSLLSGCASITNGTDQIVKIQTVSSDGKKTDGAACELTNDRGVVRLLSGQSVTVHRSGRDLMMNCNLSGSLPATGKAISRANAGLAGNILFGGGIGAVIDANTGAAFTYPIWMQLVFGEDRQYDRTGNRSDEMLVIGSLVDKNKSEVALSAPTAIPNPKLPPASLTSIDKNSLPVDVFTATLLGAPLRKGDTLEYVLIDEMTGNESQVHYRLDRISNSEMTFNSGGRVEKRDGHLISIRAPAGGIYDSSSPPEGWAKNISKLGNMWHEEYPRHKFDAIALGEEFYKIDGEQLKVLKVKYSGWIDNAVHNTGSSQRAHPMEVEALYSLELNRIVRFDSKIRSSSGVIKESLRLVHISRE